MKKMRPPPALQDVIFRNQQPVAPAVGVVPEETIYRREMRCWVAKALGHGLSEYLGADAIAPLRVVESLPLHGPVQIVIDDDGSQHELLRYLLVLEDGQTHVLTEEMRAGDSVVVADCKIHAYYSEVRRERWFDTKTGLVEEFVVCGSERDVVIALIDDEGVCFNIVNACPAQGPIWATRRGLRYKVLGGAWDGSYRIPISPGDVVESHGAA